MFCGTLRSRMVLVLTVRLASVYVRTLHRITIFREDEITISAATAAVLHTAISVKEVAIFTYTYPLIAKETRVGHDIIAQPTAHLA